MVVARSSRKLPSSSSAQQQLAAPAQKQQQRSRGSRKAPSSSKQLQQQHAQQGRSPTARTSRAGYNNNNHYNTRPDPSPANQQTMTQQKPSFDESTASTGSSMYCKYPASPASSTLMGPDPPPKEAPQTLQQQQQQQQQQLTKRKTVISILNGGSAMQNHNATFAFAEQQQHVAPAPNITTSAGAYHQHHHASHQQTPTEDQVQHHPHNSTSNRRRHQTHHPRSALRTATTARRSAFDCTNTANTTGDTATAEARERQRDNAYNYYRDGFVASEDDADDESIHQYQHHSRQKQQQQQQPFISLLSRQFRCVAPDASASVVVDERIVHHQNRVPINQHSIPHYGDTSAAGACAGDRYASNKYNSSSSAKQEDPISLMQIIEHTLRCHQPCRGETMDEDDDDEENDDPSSLMFNPYHQYPYMTAKRHKKLVNHAQQKEIFADGIHIILSIMREWPESADSQRRACQLLAEFCVESRLFADLAFQQGALPIIQQYALFPFRASESVQTDALVALERIVSYTNDPAAAAALIDDALVVSTMRQHGTCAALQAAGGGVLSVTAVYDAVSVLDAGGMEVLSTAYRLFRDFRNPLHRDVRGHVRCTIPRLLQAGSSVNGDNDNNDKPTAAEAAMETPAQRNRHHHHHHHRRRLRHHNENQRSTPAVVSSSNNGNKEPPIYSRMVGRE